MKKLFALCLAIMMIFSLTACSEKPQEPTAKTTLNIIDGEMYGLDTYQLDSTTSGHSFNSCPLFQWDPSAGTMVDYVCTDWKVSEDGKTATFNVPEGMYYSTGEQVEPEDVVASLEHGLEVSPYADGYSNIESMEVNGRQVTLHLTEFRSDMMYYLCAGFAIIIDKDELDTMTNEELMWGCHPYGMYALAEDGYVSGSEVKLVRNDGFKCFNPLVENKGPGKFENISIRFNVEDFTATEELKSGTVDIISSVSNDQRLEMETIDSIKLINTAYPSIIYTELNTDEGSIFEDINVRKAFAMTIDRAALGELVDGMIVPAYSIIYDTVQNFNEDAKNYFKENLSDDPEQAKKLLAESGWADSDGDGILEKNGKTLSFVWYAWTDDTMVAERMAEQLKAVGFDMAIEAIDWNYIYENVNADDYDAGIEYLSWAEPMLIFNACYYDLDAPGNNDAYYAKVTEAATTSDGAERTKLVGEIQMGMWENVNIIPLYSEVSYTAISSNLKGYNVLIDGTSTINDLSY